MFVGLTHQLQACEAMLKALMDVFSRLRLYVNLCVCVCARKDVWVGGCVLFYACARVLLNNDSLKRKPSYY